MRARPMAYASVCIERLRRLHVSRNALRRRWQCRCTGCRRHIRSGTGTRAWAGKGDQVSKTALSRIRCEQKHKRATSARITIPRCTIAPGASIERGSELSREVDIQVVDTLEE